MSTLVLHMSKFKKDAIRGIQSHNRRERESHSNPDIDCSRSQENYDLCDKAASNYAEAIQARIDDLLMVKAVRKDAVHMCGLIVSSDKSFFTRMGKEETRRFFEEAAAYLTDFVGKENVISAMVHMDEKTPHMHFLHVPVTPDGRLSANSIYTRASLKKLQTELPNYLQSRGFEIQRGVEQKPGAAKKHLDTREFKQQQEALNNLILESEELAQNSRQILDDLEQREEELKKNIEAYERQAEEAEKILREDSALPKASMFNYQSVLKKVSFIIAELKKALAVTHIAQKQKENLQKEVEALRKKQAQLEAEYTAHRKQSHEEKEEMETLLKKMKRLMAGYQEFLRQPEIRPLHLDFVERKRAEQLQRQQEKAQQKRERQEEEARQQAERERHIQQEPEAVTQRRRSRMR
ncbi:MobV family relaxase [uncultured Desulfovibrio sp.]|uniref:MobV family relaxase n=2 Tax=uncultured Desulfovibrio sp. TaxID=167968 RepID=UPI002625D9D8|nr:MobV family relaxase [uncultured Desulfovibrio sp.]